MGSEPRADLRENLTLKNFFAGLAHGILRDLFRLLSAAAIGVGIGAGVCLSYGLPLALSLVGGVIVVAVFAVLPSDA